MIKLKEVISKKYAFQFDERMEFEKKLKQVIEAYLVNEIQRLDFLSDHHELTLMDKELREIMDDALGTQCTSKDIATFLKAVCNENDVDLVIDDSENIKYVLIIKNT